MLAADVSMSQILGCLYRRIQGLICFSVKPVNLNITVIPFKLIDKLTPQSENSFKVFVLLALHAQCRARGCQDFCPPPRLLLRAALKS